MSKDVEIILDLYAGSGAFSEYYAEAGYDVRRVELPQDVRLYIPPKRVRGIISCPPCTDLAGSGARWWAAKGEKALINALSMVDATFRMVWLCSPAWWVLENPVGRLSRFIGKPRMYFNPCDYGDPYTKKTCLWGDFVPPKKCPVEPEKKSRIHYMPPSPDRGRLRSITPPGFAKAFFEANR
jgi:hypothetical protein